MKGFIQTTEGLYLADCVSSALHLSRYEEAVPEEEVGKLVLLAGKGMQLRKSIKQAKACMGTSSKRCSMDHNIKIRIEAGEKLSREEAAQLLETAVGSRDYYELLYFANQYSRQVFEEKGLIFAQIGLDLQPCGINCKFCSMAKDSMCGKDDFVRSLEKVVEEAKALVDTDIQDCS